MTELLVTYPAGSTAESSVVVAVTHTEGELLFAVDRTPCHPESPRWPDQPADRCVLESTETEAPAQVSVRCAEGVLLRDESRLVIGNTTADASNLADSDTTAETVPCVVHLAPVSLDLSVGDRVFLRVDERYREAVSHSHSRCHLVSLALNAALADAWRADKQPPARDSLGHPDFDKLAIVSSAIDEQGSLDVYRVGRHVRKAGLQAQMLEDPRALAERIEGIAKGWLKSSPHISVHPGECSLSERRTWSCTLPEGVASFPCGGTHPSHLEPEEALRVELSWEPDEKRLAMLARGVRG
jgi:alanyl-tRNA synthetase